MNLINQIDDDFKQALKSKDSQTVGVLRMLKSAIKNKSIEIKTQLDESQVIQILKSEVKKRKESIEAFQNAQRDDLVKKEQQELPVLEKYLPEQLTQDQIREKVQKVYDELPKENQQSFGDVMKASMQAMQGLADGQVVSQIVKELLNQ